jgi:hypothetical protein
LIYEMEKEPRRPLFAYLAVLDRAEDIIAKDVLMHEFSYSRENSLMDVSNTTVKGKYLTGPSRKGVPVNYCPHFFLKKESGEYDRKKLVVYQKGGLVMICTISEEPSDSSFFRVLEDFCTPHFDALVKNLSVQSGRPDPEDPLKFIYFNKVNLAVKHSNKPKAPPVSTELFQIMRSLHKDFEE